MKLPNGFFRNGKAGTLLVDQLEGVPIASDLFFVAIARLRFAEDQRSDPGLIHHDPLDAV